ncbi:MAG: hypothetical protein AVDCRST_MAG40-2021 [uncultured Gemmatimonadaceae bacterium]|uniref:Uncharacterized protein n=1 Tax=uncultured Gemmatimonadaceae bacterium TaxID=246130 RepID=A0A6J4LID4_9BACT|nr:MAG: hypothetical protein AVDCRST_MAG40-2021 [uncultured Gemmatimonadaceae bacterium]
MTATRWQRDPLAAAAASLLLPGLGQWLQRRRAAALWLGLEAASVLALGIAAPSVRPAAWAAGTAVALWSVLDGAHAARRPRDPAA